MKTAPMAHHTSSAYSTNAAPNEDWTKISDLAERRRIQNRIAQRNYRKKLKKRLEDLERRAESSSISPEQKPAELPEQLTPFENDVSLEDHSQPSHGSRIKRACSSQSEQLAYLPRRDERNMFSDQFTRQLTTSPPPFAYHSPPPVRQAVSQPIGYDTTCYGLPDVDLNMQLYPRYLPNVLPTPQNTLDAGAMPIKQQIYSDDDVNPFSLSYATLTGFDDAALQSYPYTPPLSDSFDYSYTESPPEFMPLTPPMFCDHWGERA